MKTTQSEKIIELSSEDDAKDDDNEEKKPKVKVMEEVKKKKLKTLRKDVKQPKINNYFTIKNENYFATFQKAQLPAQVIFIMILLIP